MTDVGKFDALEAVIVAALSTPAITGVESVQPSMSYEDLLLYDGGSRADSSQAVLGVVEGDATVSSLPGLAAHGRYAIGSGRFCGNVQWHVAILVRNARGGRESRSFVRTLAETVRDRVNFLLGNAAGARFAWVGEQRIDGKGDDEDGGYDYLCRVATFDIDVTMGEP